MQLIGTKWCAISTRHTARSKYIFANGFLWLLNWQFRSNNTTLRRHQDSFAVHDFPGS